MGEYKQPQIIMNSDLAEGVFAASGETCYTTEAKIIQRPELGRNDYRIQVNARHHGDHTREKQKLIVTFNKPVTFKSCNGKLLNGNGTNILTIELSYHQNPNDNIGFGDLTVEADSGLAILKAQTFD